MTREATLPASAASVSCSGGCDRPITANETCENCRMPCHPECAGRHLCDASASSGGVRPKLSRSNSAQDKKSLLLEVEYLKSIIDTKNALIKQLNANNSLLYEKIAWLEEKLTVCGSLPSAPARGPSVDAGVDAPCAVAVDVSESRNDVAADRSYASAAASRAPVAAARAPSAAVASRGSRGPSTGLPRALICGSSSDSGCLLVGAPRRPPRKWFHVNNVKPGTSCSEVSTFVGSALGISDIACSRFTSCEFYTSFKVGVWEKDAITFLNGSIWPDGVVEREFFFNRSQSSVPFHVPDRSGEPPTDGANPTA